MQTLSAKDAKYVLGRMIDLPGLSRLLSPNMDGQSS